MDISVATKKNEKSDCMAPFLTDCNLIGKKHAIVAAGMILGCIPFLILGTISGGLISLCLALCNVTDSLYRRIPNRYSYSAILLGLLLNAFGSLLSRWFSASQLSFLGTVGISQSLFGAGVCFSTMFLIYCLSHGKSGAGDVKLAAALGAFFGPVGGVSILAWCHILAACWTVVILVTRMGPAAFCLCLARHLCSWLLPGMILPPKKTIGRYCRFSVPLAVFFTLGVCIASLGGIFRW
jgi:Flp pilus assembly protein protease CpaA